VKARAPINFSPRIREPDSTMTKPSLGPGRSRRWALLLFAALWLPATLPAESDPAARIATLQQAALEDELAWELLASLTTEVGPRMAGTPGDALAVAWAQQRMAALGFDRVWTEPVTFPRWRRGAESAAITVPRQQALAVTALGGSPGTGGALRAEVIGFADLAALEAADPAAVAGRIVYVGARMERSQSGQDYGRVVVQRGRGPFVAAAKGAAALVIRSVGTDDNRLPHTGMMSGSEAGEPAPSAAISNPDADLLEALLTRGPVTLELALDCGFDGTATSYNVIGEYDGRDADAGFVAIGGHLDSWDLGSGAHDDGAGVAITLAAAQRVAQATPRPRRGIRVVLFANEEQGVLGGQAYAGAHAGELARHAIGAESDLGGGRIFRFRSRVGPGAEPAMTELAALLAPLGIPHEPGPPAYGGADLGQMVKLGMPAVDLDHDATLYFDHHHTANDTLDKVDPQALRFNVAAWVTFLAYATEFPGAFGPVEPGAPAPPPTAKR